MKKAIIAVLVVFLGFWLLSDPGGLASMAKDGGGAAADGISTFFTAVIDFIGRL